MYRGHEGASPATPTRQKSKLIVSSREFPHVDADTVANDLVIVG